MITSVESIKSNLQTAKDLVEGALDSCGDHDRTVAIMAVTKTHPASIAAMAMEAGVPPQVSHIIAAHAGEGDMVKRSTEAYIVHHADFMTFLPFKNKA